MKWSSIFWITPLAASLSFGQASQKQHDPQAISFDATHLAQYSNVELIDLLSEESLKKNAQRHRAYSLLPPDRHRTAAGGPEAEGKLQVSLDSHAIDFTSEVEQELIKRSPYRDLFDLFERTSDDFQQAWIMDVLSQMRAPAADSFFHRYLHGKTDEMTTYLALKYFALVCDQEALGILNKHYFQYQISSREWAAIVGSFGECKYKPAVPHILETVTAAALNLGYASHLSLLAMYPDAKIEFGEPVETRAAWKKYLDHQR